MNQRVYRFSLSLLSYWIVSAYAGHIFVFPSEVIHLSVFIPPILGLMWGPVAALGAGLGGLLAAPELGGLLNGSGSLEWYHFLGQGLWVFLAGFLPGFLWHRLHITPGERAFSARVRILFKFLLILLVTFSVTSVFRTLTASPVELEATRGWLGIWKTAHLPQYFLACFANDFLLAVFLGLPWFIFLISTGYSFYKSEENRGNAGAVLTTPLFGSTRKSQGIVLCFYAFFPAWVAYLDLGQVYGMDHMDTWMRFVAECLSMMDLYLVLMIYLMLRYRRSIMMEIVFLVALTVFLSTAVLGWGSSIALGNLVEKHVNDSLRAMSVICRERLDRTFFCARQAVTGMEQQAIQSIESYDRLASDPAYRESYLAAMEHSFNNIAMSTDGSIALYLRLAPEIAGPKGGFATGREDVRWEGALSPFIRRDPIDLSRYSPDDVKNVGWYYIPFKNHHATWIEPYVDPTVKSYVISYVSPLFIDNRFVGVVGMDIDFNFIIQELRRMSIYNYGYVYIMNRNGLVLYHKDQPQGTPFRPNPEFQELEIYLTNGMWLGIATPLSEVHDERNRILLHLVAAILIVAMLISLGSISLASRAIRPLAGMTEAAKRIASGDLNVELSYESGNELGLLTRSIREMAAKLEVYVYRDKLTGLRNAASYMSKGGELDAQGDAGSDLSYGVIIFDVNFLKKVNDQYGHASGNELLRHASQVICRVFDHSPVYRIGGDEFAAILERQDYENRDALLRRFDEEVSKETFTAGEDTLNISVARGLGLYSKGMDFAAVAKQADAAMYDHKSSIKAKFGEDVR